MPGKAPEGADDDKTSRAPAFPGGGVRGLPVCTPGLAWGRGAQRRGAGVSSVALTCWLEGPLPPGCVCRGGGQGLRFRSGVGREGWQASPALVVGGHGLVVAECGLFVLWVWMTAPWLWGDRWWADQGLLSPRQEAMLRDDPWCLSVAWGLEAGRVSAKNGDSAMPGPRA